MKVEIQDCRRNRSISHPDCGGVEEMRVLMKEPVQGEGDNIFERQGKAFHYVPFIIVTISPNCELFLYISGPSNYVES